MAIRSSQNFPISRDEIRAISASFDFNGNLLSFFARNLIQRYFNISNPSRHMRVASRKRERERERGGGGFALEEPIMFAVSRSR